MPVTVRMYMMSMLAMQKDKEAEQGVPSYVHWNHGVTLAIEDSIEAAGEKGRAAIYQVFPKADGWGDHSLVVSPVPQLVFDAIRHYTESGQFVEAPDPSESTQHFRLDRDVPGADVNTDPSGHEH